MKSENYRAYFDRFTSPLSFVQGEQLIDCILETANTDPDLTSEELNSIINECWEQHKKLMERNYKNGWTE